MLPRYAGKRRLGRGTKTTVYVFTQVWWIEPNGYFIYIIFIDFLKILELTIVLEKSSEKIFSIHPHILVETNDSTYKPSVEFCQP